MLPSGAPGKGSSRIVVIRRSVVVSRTETVSLAVSATNRVVPASVIAVGCVPTATLVRNVPVARSTTETLPVAARPCTPSVTIGVPAESFVLSPTTAGRPPSSLT